MQTRGPDQLPDDRTFAAAVERVRKARGLSLREFSKLLLEDTGMRLLPSGICKVEQGQRRVSIGEAVAIAKVLGCDLGDMLSGEPIRLTVTA